MFFLEPGAGTTLLFSNVNINALDHLKMNAVFVGNTWHFHNEIDFLVLATFRSCRFQARQFDDEIDLTSSERFDCIRTVVGSVLDTMIMQASRPTSKFGMRHWPYTPAFCIQAYKYNAYLFTMELDKKVAKLSLRSCKLYRCQNYMPLLPFPPTVGKFWC